MSALLLLLLACGNKPDPLVAELEQSLLQMRADMDDLEAAYVDQRAQLAEVDRDLNAVNTGALGHDATNEKSSTAHGKLASKLEALGKSVQAMKAPLDETVELVDAIDEDLEVVEDNLDIDDDGVADLEDRLIGLEDRLTALERAHDELDEVVATHIEATRGVEALLEKLVVTSDGDVVVTGANLVMDSAGRAPDGTPNTKGNLFMAPPRR